MEWPDQKLLFWKHIVTNGPGFVIVDRSRAEERRGIPVGDVSLVLSKEIAVKSHPSGQ